MEDKTVNLFDDLTTKEEIRVTLYSAATPTNPSSVTPDTPLIELNLNWRERDLPERQRTKHVHRLHPYLGKFIPQLVEIFLRKYFRPGQTVLDPFSGSGTTLVQANELGIHSLGYDVSAFNVLVTRAKTAKYDLDWVEYEIKDILGRVKKTDGASSRQLSLWDFSQGQQAQPESLYLNEWYAPQTLYELLTYRDLIDEYQNQDILKVILSRAARSARLTTHFDLDFPKKPQTEPYWCYKHSRMCSPIEEAYKFLRRYSLDTIQRLKEFASLRQDAVVDVRHEDSRYADIPPVDGLITSPPYVGLIDYHEQHRYAYELLGLEDRRDLEIGAAAEGRSKQAQEQYIQGIVQVFQNACRSMPVGGYLIVVAGDKDNLYDEIALRVGVEVEAILKRHVNRRTGRRSSEYYESVFIWRKK
jgi:hypothetical protein